MLTINFYALPARQFQELVPSAFSLVKVGHALWRTHTQTHTIVIENGNGNRWDSCTAPRLTRLSLIQVKHQRAPASPSLPLSPRLLIKIYDFSHAHMSMCVWGVRVCMV